MKKIGKYLLVFIAGLTTQFANAKSDSLLKIWNNNSLHDTIRVKALHDFSFGLLYLNTDSARVFAKIELEFSKKNKLFIWEISASNTIGLSFFIKNDYTESLKWFQKTVGLCEKNSSKKMSGSEKELLLINYGNAWHNTGNVYLYMGDYKRALTNYEKGLEFRLNTKSKFGLGGSYTNLGIVSRRLGKKEKALSYFRASLSIDVKSKNDKGIADNYINIGSVHQDLQRLDSSLIYYRLALPLFEKLNDKYGILNSYLGMGYTAKEAKNFVLAMKNCQKALDISKEIKDAYNEQFCLMCIYETYVGTEDWKNAFDSYKRWNKIQDSLFSAERTRELTSLEMTFESKKKDLKDSLEKVEEKKRNELKEAEQKTNLEKERIQKYLLYGGISVLIFLAFFIYNRLRKSQEQSKIITIQKLEVELQKKIAEEQRDIIEEKHKEITDSINYAERIQRSFLASEEMLSKYLKEYFVLFQPKDVVSGDFYWSWELKDGKFLLACADSTGHGVPGAIMSLLNISSLEKSAEKYHQPNEILNETRNIIIDRLKKDGSIEGGKDGMDCSMLSFDFKNSKLSFSLANNPLWIVRDGEIIEYSPDKMPVGKHDKQHISFSNQEIDLRKNDMIYIFTDGYADQFGGEKGKKFKYSSLKRILIEISNESSDTQKEKLQYAFTQWKGNLEQIDDVCIIGIRV